MPDGVSFIMDNVCYLELQSGSSYYYRVVSVNQLGNVTTNMIHPEHFNIFLDGRYQGCFY